MVHFLIIGAGGFGRRAVATLSARLPGAVVVLVDSDPRAFELLPEALRPQAIAMDGIRYLDDAMSGRVLPDWIVPALPRHLAYEWVAGRIRQEGAFESLAVPAAVMARLPNAMRGPTGEVYFSNADFICPPACPEPEEVCTHTGKVRPLTLHSWLPTLVHPPFRNLVLRSLPLAPGVGGYCPEALFRLLGEVRAAPGPVLLSTACACHGVMHGFAHGVSSSGNRDNSP